MNFEALRFGRGIGVSWKPGGPPPPTVVVVAERGSRTSPRTSSAGIPRGERFAEVLGESLTAGNPASVDTNVVLREFAACSSHGSANPLVPRRERRSIGGCRGPQAPQGKTEQDHRDRRVGRRDSCGDGRDRAGRSEGRCATRRGRRGVGARARAAGRHHSRSPRRDRRATQRGDRDRQRGAGIGRPVGRARANGIGRAVRTRARCRIGAAASGAVRRWRWRWWRRFDTISPTRTSAHHATATSASSTHDRYGRELTRGDE